MEQFRPVEAAVKQILLGNTGIRISPLVFGTLPLGYLQAGLSPGEGGRLIRYALERGVNTVDTATLYETYAHVREGLKGFAGDVTVITKTHAPDPATARAHVERGLKELGRERLDIVHVHAARIADPLVERAGVIEELVKMKQEGKIAHVGLSSHYIAAVRKVASCPEIEVVHPLINRTGMGILDGTPGEMEAAIKLCAEAGKGVYAMKALAGGNLIAEARASFAYVLGLAGVHGVAVGMLSEDEIDANIALFSGMPPDSSVWEKLEQRRRRLAIMQNFCKSCGNCVAACGSGALTLEEGKPVVDEAACVLCGYCGAECPEFIIRVV
jgi:aryl-alcohol dehydrogenase-like predicted oxidoreductase/NAD-dependent dihydropyrimidine dehydrogenase PreA subunit